MPLKVTVIGGTPVRDAVRPTSLGGLPASAKADGLPASTCRPTSIQPSPVKPAPAEGSPVLANKPTALPSGEPLPKVADGAPVHASVLPGVQRKAVVVTLDDLGRRFPGLDATLKTRVQSLLAGVSPTSMDTSAWLSFGTPAQETVAKLVKDRLTLMESAETRGVTRYLARLHTLLADVLAAMEGGLFKKSPQKVWEGISAEVRQLEGLLSQASPKLMELTARIDGLIEQNREAGVTVSANALVADYLTDHVSPEAGSLLVSRMAALSTSQALTLEQIQTLEHDKTIVQELAVLVQDGVLLKLPAVYSQLADLSAKPSETQRCMAVEKLSEIVHHIKRKT
jgi:hypothetical protein